MNPSRKGCVLERSRRERGNLRDLVACREVEARRIDHASSDFGEISVVVRDPFAYPEKSGGLRPVVLVRVELRGTQSLHVPRMKNLVSVDRHYHRRAKQVGAIDGHVRVLVL